jgi:hemolysin D
LSSTLAWHGGETGQTSSPEKQRSVEAADIVGAGGVQRLLWEDKLVNLSPGMAVSVEIKTGQRRLIEFFLSPLLKYGQESIRER